MIDVEARAHGLVQQPQAQADASRVDQTGEGAGQPGDIRDEAGMAGNVLIGRRQGRQLQFTFGARFQRQGLSQRFAQRQQRLRRSR